MNSKQVKRIVTSTGGILDGILNLAVKSKLPDKKLLMIKNKAKKRQLADVLNSLNMLDFIRAERTLYSHSKMAQKLVLSDIIRTSADTEFGRKYHFDKIKSISDFRKNVPITSWSDYEDYSRRMTNGEENLLFPGQATFFYRTSGTTSDFKFIPESEKEVVARKALTKARYMERVHASSFKALSKVFSFYNKADMLITKGGIPAGTASGRTGQIAEDNVGAKTLGIQAYDPLIVEELEDEALYYTIMRLTIVYDDMGAIMGNNAHMMSVMIDVAREHAKEIIEDIRYGTNKYELSDELASAEKEALTPNPARADELLKLYDEDKFIPRYYWPNLRLASFWLGGSVGVFVNEIKDLLPKKVTYVDTGYGASEAKVNIPISANTPAAPLSVFSSFYEFIPEEGGEVLLPEELEDGKTYELLLTTYGGLYRYRIKDYVRVDGFTGTTPNIYFVSKASDVANLTQEKIAGSILINALSDIVSENGMRLCIAQIYPDSENTCYDIYIETDDIDMDTLTFNDIIEDGLCKKVVQYGRYRHELKLINKCNVYLMKEGFGETLNDKYSKGNATASQVKIPVVISERPDENWIIRT